MTDASETAIRARHGGQILVDALRVHGVDRIFSVPGESYLDVLDALHDAPEIQLIVNKHEGAASNMAEADGKMTGRPGICFVTRGPGATHASNGVHTAFQDSTPMILFVGQIASTDRDREAFQEVDYRAMFGTVAKWVAEIDDVSRIPEYVLRAFQTATSGRPGPVVLALPEDMLGATAMVADTRPYQPVQAAPGDADVQALLAELARARRPLLVLGGSGWTDEACAALRSFAEAHHLPVTAAFRRQDLMDNDSACYVGQLGIGLDPALAAKAKDADLIVAFGTRMGDSVTKGYTLFEPPALPQRFVHIHADANELGRVYQPDLAINAAPARMAHALAGARMDADWQGWTAELRGIYERFNTPHAPRADQVGPDLGQIVLHMRDALPHDAIISNGAGNFTVWVHRFHRYRRRVTELAPTNGAMGYGFPAAIAAKLRHPDRVSVCVAGDGDFLMYPQELATAAENGVNVIVLVVNNGMYGTIRMHQEMRFPGRVSGTRIANPDFVRLAEACGAHGELVERTEDFPAAFERARAAGRPAVIELRTDPRRITPDKMLA